MSATERAGHTTEPLELWRAWQYDGRRLRSPMLRSEWQPGVPFTAECPRAFTHSDLVQPPPGGTFPCTWRLVPDGEHDLDSAIEQTRLYNAFASAAGRPVIAPPAHEPPEGCGWSLRPAYAKVSDPGTVPHPGCSCGIYALDDPRNLPPGDLYGKVKLWGRIVRGGRGARAQHGYPSVLHIPSLLLHDEGLRAYGVPLIPLVMPRDPWGLGSNLRHGTRFGFPPPDLPPAA